MFCSFCDILQLLSSCHWSVCSFVSFVDVHPVALISGICSQTQIEVLSKRWAHFNETIVSNFEKYIVQVLLLFRTKCDSSIKAALLAQVSFWQKMKRHKEFPMELNILRQKRRNMFIFLAHISPVEACKERHLNSS